MEQTNDKAPLALPRGYKRPSIEEFVAARYDAKDYEQFFQVHEARLAAAYAAGEITDESYGKSMTGVGQQAPLVEGLPDALHIQSQVRKVGTRTTRARQPTRHRFKQYLFGDPSKRLVRSRKVGITSRELVDNFDELLAKEAAGILSVHTTDGLRVNLEVLRQRLSGEQPAEVEQEELEQDGQDGPAVNTAPTAPLIAAPPQPAPLPNPPLDSAANDTPAGVDMPLHVDGTFPGDPAAQRALERMVDDKSRELERNTEDPASAPADPASAPADPAAATVPATDPAASEDPAADRASKSASKKKGSHK